MRAPRYRVNRARPPRNTPWLTWLWRRRVAATGYFGLVHGGQVELPGDPAYCARELLHRQLCTYRYGLSRRLYDRHRLQRARSAEAVAAWWAGACNESRAWPAI